jgi:glucokinase
MKKEPVYTIGIDIGGTKMAATLFDGSKSIEFYKLATPKENLNDFCVMLKALTEPLFKKAEDENFVIKSIGIGVPGIVDAKDSRILFAPNIPILNNIKPGELIKDKLNLEIPIKIDNDANCFVKAEASVGAGKKLNNILGIVIGTGIGGSWSFNKKIYKGAHGYAGEPGEMIINLQEKITLEQAYHKIMQNNPESLAEEAEQGDILAKKKFEEFGSYLGMTLANIVNLIDPEIIIIGGGVSNSIDLFLESAKNTMQEFLINENYKNLEIIKTKLGEKAGAIGAALL